MGVYSDNIRGMIFSVHAKHAIIFLGEIESNGQTRNMAYWEPTRSEAAPAAIASPVCEYDSNAEASA